MRLGQRKLARKNDPTIPFELQRLNIISHLVTIGSPIDRIHYFFELHDSRYHRYNRISERLRGDTNDPPFSTKSDVGTSWVNIWDDSDFLSSQLFTPRGRMPNKLSIIDIHTYTSHLLTPVNAHSDYFFSISAVRVLFWLSFFGRLPSDLEDPADAIGFQGFMLRLLRPNLKHMVILEVWLAFVGLISIQLSLIWPLIITFFCFILFAIFIAIIQFLGWRLDQRSPLRFDPTKTHVAY